MYVLQRAVGNLLELLKLCEHLFHHLTEPERLTWMCHTAVKSFQCFTGETRPGALPRFTVNQDGMTKLLQVGACRKDKSVL